MHEPIWNCDEKYSLLKLFIEIYDFKIKESIENKKLTYRKILVRSQGLYNFKVIFVLETIGRTIESCDNGLISGWAYKWDFTVFS